MMNKTVYYIINGITFFRLINAVLLIFLVVFGRFDWFKWLLLVSFVSDAVDGLLARKFKMTSAFGAHLDSIADDCTILAAIIGICIWDELFFVYELLPIAILLLLYGVQNILAVRRYKRPTSFHTYTAKVAAISQAAFLLSFFFLPDPVYWLFFLMIALTCLDLVEEIILTIMLSDYRTNVKGVYWVLTERKRRSHLVN